VFRYLTHWTTYCNYEKKQGRYKDREMEEMEEDKKQGQKTGEVKDGQRRN
jgi:hypothetical protein